MPNEDALLLTFRLDGMNFCVSSVYILAIAIPDEIMPLPEMPESVAGLMSYGENLSQFLVIEMRTLFGKTNLKKYLESFAVMKQMHIDWIDALEAHVRYNQPFLKTVDPHKCKFGQWYDNFDPESSRMKRLLKRIHAPHDRIHQCGAEILALEEQEGNHQAEVEALFEEAKEICQDDIVPLLDRLIDVYHAANRGALLVLNLPDRQVALLVDEVCTLIPGQQCCHSGNNPHIRRNPYIRDGILFEGQFFFEIDVEQIVGLNHREIASSDLLPVQN